MSFYIKKTSGEPEEFDAQKLKRSLIIPGASPELADKIVSFVMRNLNNFPTTDDIYKFALDMLSDQNPPVAARYNLKRALLELGPTGFPFEKFFAEILKADGYDVKLNQIVSGWCVDHEIDILYRKDNEQGMIECKFHNIQFYKTDVQVPLYTQARFEDIKKTWTPDNVNEKLTDTWIVTNTKFTYDAIKYANCSGIKMTSWNYPAKDNLARLIDKFGLHPITVLTSLNNKQKQFLMQNGLVLCKDSPSFVLELKHLGFNSKKIDKILTDARLTCSLN